MVTWLTNVWAGTNSESACVAVLVLFLSETEKEPSYRDLSPKVAGDVCETGRARRSLNLERAKCRETN
jgi:hypothetical protein